MKIRFISLLLALSLLLSGCGFLDGSDYSVTPHREQRSFGQPDAVTASNFQELTTAIGQIISAGRESGVILLADYPEGALEGGIRAALSYAKGSFPIGNYAVEDIQYELGANGNVPALAVTVTYHRSLTEIQRIRHLRDMDAAERLIQEALINFEADVVLLIQNYKERDLTQYVQDYAEAHPQIVMETPKVTETVYGQGRSRVVELIFTYQNSREALRQMKTQVEPVFNSAVLYVSGDGADRQKFSQLYAFLMERFDYTIETSLTPAYSLLRHAVGDSRAFATVYAAMCRGAGLECLTVTGTCSGEPRTWNIVREGEEYYHVDLLRSNELGRYSPFADEQMTGYVWDYSAYPACEGIHGEVNVIAETQPTEEEILEEF